MALGDTFLIMATGETQVVAVTDAEGRLDDKATAIAALRLMKETGARALFHNCIENGKPLRARPAGDTGIAP